MGERDGAGVDAAEMGIGLREEVEEDAERRGTGAEEEVRGGMVLLSSRHWRHLSRATFTLEPDIS